MNLVSLESASNSPSIDTTHDTLWFMTLTLTYLCALWHLTHFFGKCPLFDSAGFFSVRNYTCVEYFCQFSSWGIQIFKRYCHLNGCIPRWTTVRQYTHHQCIRNSVYIYNIMELSVFYYWDTPLWSLVHESSSAFQPHSEIRSLVSTGLSEFVYWFMRASKTLSLENFVN